MDTRIEQDSPDKDESSSSLEAKVFASCPFLINLTDIVRHERKFYGGGEKSTIGSPRRSHGEGRIFPEGIDNVYNGSIHDISRARSGDKESVDLSSLSPSVLARLTLIEKAAGTEVAAGTIHKVTSPVAVVNENRCAIAINWSRVRITPSDVHNEDGIERALREGARLAVSCHATLREQQDRRQQLRQQRDQQPSSSMGKPSEHLVLMQRYGSAAPVGNRRREEEGQGEGIRGGGPADTAKAQGSGDKSPGDQEQFKLPFASVLPSVVEAIVGSGSNDRGCDKSDNERSGSGSDGVESCRDEQVYVALCVCLTVLERALYDLYRAAKLAAATSERSNSSDGLENTGNCKDAPVTCEDAGIGGGHSFGGGGDTVGGGSEEGVGAGATMMILRDLIATPEITAALPEQMVAVLRLLLLPTGFNIRNLVWHGFLAPHELPRELAALVLAVTLSIPTSAARTSPSSARVMPKDAPCRSLASAPWKLESCDDQLGYPPALTSALGSLLSERFCWDELEEMVRHSAFVLPGREGTAMYALEALKEGHDVLFLVAVLPILEHGLRCLFCCANDSPEHFFAQIRQYYSTLDGFGQRARHQLLLDQEMSGCPGRPNLLLATLGPGMSAVLLDLFMMSAGPCLRGKVAHAEIDMASALVHPPLSAYTRSLHSLSSLSCAAEIDDGGRKHAGESNDGFARPLCHSPAVVVLTAAVFLTLCRRYDPRPCAKSERLARAIDAIEDDGSGDMTGGGGIARRHGYSTRGIGDVVVPPPGSSDAFLKAMSSCESEISSWVPAFHPHELLETQLQNCWTAFDCLAVALERRKVTLEALPGGNLARMSVVVSPESDHSGGDDGCNDDIGGDALVDGATTDNEGEENNQICDGCDGDGERSDARVSKGQGDSHLKHGVQRNYGSREGGSKGGLVLTVTDKATRLIMPQPSPLMPPPPIDEAGGNRTTPKKKRLASQDGSGSVFPVMARVNEALREHSLSSAHRFKRFSHARRHQARHPSGRGDTSDRQCSSPGSKSSRLLEDAKPMLTPPSSSLSGLTSTPSAFATYMHVEDCPDTLVCGELECHNRSRNKNLEGPQEEVDGRRMSSANQISMNGHLDSVDDGRFNASCGRANDSQIASWEGSAVRRRKWRDRHIVRQRLRSRISPETNVITAVALPQIACMSSLCRACVDFARDIVGRISELEVLVSSGGARSGQRYAYATTLCVAPTLLHFLASALAAVEAFVVEWHVHHGQEQKQPPPQHDPEDHGNGSRHQPLLTRAGKITPAKTSGPSSEAIKTDVAEPKVMLVAGVESEAGSDVASRLAFLRRLAAVTGALSLCIKAGPPVVDAGKVEGHMGQGPKEVARLVGIGQDGGACVSVPSCRKEVKRKAGSGTGRKGYIQSLSELVMFLESKAARCGYAGR